MIRSLLGIGAIVLFWVCGPSCAQVKEPALPEGRWPQQVIGHGVTVEVAKNVALDEAVRVVRVLMKQQNPPLQSFVPTRDYVQENLLTGAGHAGNDVVIEDVKGVEQPFKKWVYDFKTDQNWWSDIVRRDQAAARAIRQEANQTLAARTVWCLSVLLLAGFGYVQLNAYTQRRYTTWLRVAGVSVASVALAISWLVMNLV